jgi:hypothetical protein
MNVDPKSLSRTIDLANDALEAGLEIPQAERDAVVAWLLDRQSRTGRDIGAFEPLPEDLSGGAHLYTGERLRTNLAARNVLTAEAARLLLLFGGDDLEVRAAVDRAASRLDVSCFVRGDCAVGECAHSSVAHLRLLGALQPNSPAVVRRIGVIREHRDERGRWRSFPFYYTVFTLSEVGAGAAKAELRYALPACERALSRSAKTPVYDARRRAILNRILSLGDLRLL